MAYLRSLEQRAEELLHRPWALVVMARSTFGFGSVGVAAGGVIGTLAWPVVGTAIGVVYLGFAGIVVGLVVGIVAALVLAFAVDRPSKHRWARPIRFGLGSRCAVRITIGVAALGSAAGTTVGLATYPPTFFFASIEGAFLGGLVGVFVGTVTAGIVWLARLTR